MFSMQMLSWPHVLLKSKFWKISPISSTESAIVFFGGVINVTS